MATVLFVGGVSPDVTMDELKAAFDPYALASSVVRHPETGKCIGQAYVTVPDEHVAQALSVSQIGNNNVAVFPVNVEAWLSPTGPHPSNSGPGGLGLAAAGPTSAGGHDLSGLPTSSHAHLQAVLEQLRAQLSTNPRLAFNGKPFYMLLHEICQKRQLTLQVSDGMEGSTFCCTINVVRGSTPICNGRAAGINKKDAKHNAAASCLDAMLAIGQVSSNELVGSMTTASLAPAGGGGISGDMAPGGPITSAAAATAMAQTNNILKLGPYPRTAEVMSVVQSTEAGRLKTAQMLLNEYATRARLSVQHEELPVAPIGPGPAPFRYLVRLTDQLGMMVAQATGAEVRSKQEAKQASAAAMIDFLISNGFTTVDGIARGGR